MVEEFDRHAAEYSEKINESLGFSGRDHAFFTKLKAQVLCHRMRSLATGALPKVLDVGCGVAAVHPWLRSASSLIVGVDVSERSLDIAGREHPESRFICYDGQVLPFDDRTFDAVVAICVVHHVPTDQWSAFFTELHRVLRAGGMALVIEHNPYNPLTRFVVNSCPLDDNATLLGAGKCRALMTDAGFSKVSSEHYAVLPFLSPIARGLERMIGAIPLGAQYLTYGSRGA